MAEELENTAEAPVVEEHKPEELLKTEEPKAGKPQRKIIFSTTVDLEVYKDDELVDTLHVERSLPKIADALKALTEDKKVSLYVKEDPTQSDPLPEGEEIPTYPVFEIVKLGAKEALQRVQSQILSMDATMMEFHRLSEFTSFRGDLKAINVTCIFGEAQPNGFTYVYPVGGVSGRTVIEMYKATITQAEAFRKRAQELFPDIKFDEVLPEVKVES